MTRTFRNTSAQAMVAAAAAGFWLAPTTTLAQDATADIMAKADQCFGASFSREEGPVRDVRVIFSATDTTEEPRWNSFVSFEYSLWDVPNETYGVTSSCTASGDDIFCTGECDSGALRIQLAEDGRLFVEAPGTYYMLMQGTDGMVPPVMDADGIWLNDIFALSPVDDPDGKCNATPQQTFVELRAGDLSPRVKILETKLNSLGHFLEFPNTVFDEQTTAAVLSFQTQYQLPATGVVDQRTARVIDSAAFTSGGGC
ncbi:peptidoglycan-binding domain-containing protein [Oricola sp.]|uniref:peptidoglycan-binding domain-containing protein n=1 Tax=Oricola sp. TaxID=1979950 RepID=UPI0025F783EF|nr:peptidoglycan-binding domain-containing protein [Oricola sp.]MCI5076915.1 peptidoglycan-binding protein [Oricola sp.]